MISTNILEANKKLHRRLVLSGEYQKSPHFLLENKNRVRRQFENEVLPFFLGQKINAIDFGCGTGFIIDLLVDVVETIDGVDITQEMLDEVDTSSGHVTVTLSEAERTPFENYKFNLATAYSFLDHLSDIEIFFKEVYRVLKNGGVFYTGLNPNIYFAGLIKSALNNDPTETGRNELVNREVMSMLNNGTYYEEKFGIEKHVVEAAEYIKTIDGGICPYELKRLALSVGFSHANLSLDWFLGQATYGNAPNELQAVKKYLNKTMPASVPFFKYFNYVFVK